MSTEQHESARIRYEQAWLKPFVDSIPEWDSLRFTQRPLARSGKTFVLWRLDDNLQPEILDKLTVTSFTCNTTGPAMMFCAEKGPGVLVQEAPVQLHGHQIYLWLPAFMDLRFAPYSYDHGDPTKRLLSWRFVLRSMGNPEMVEKRVPGQVFLSEGSSFHKLWPAVPF